MLAKAWPLSLIGLAALAAAPLAFALPQASGPDVAQEAPAFDPTDTRDLAARLQDDIDRLIGAGGIDRRAARLALRELDDIRRLDAIYRADDGRLTEPQRRDIVDRMDALRARLWGRPGG